MRKSRVPLDARSNQMKTYTATPSDIKHQWYIVDASGMVLGRLAAEVAKIIRGKHKPMYTPHMDTGDNVIVINASKVKVTGKKSEQKRYFHHTGYMAHERFTPFAAMHPTVAASESLGRSEIVATVEGASVTEQAGSIRVAVASALVKIDERHRSKPRHLGLLTRNARAVERKKTGRPKARKKFQF